MTLKVIPINLKRRIDRLCAFYGAMQSHRYPIEVIQPFEAHDGLEYGTVFEVREAALQEFPFWSRLDDDWLGARYLGIGSLCCLWSMQSVLNQIGQEPANSLCVMTTDHFVLSRSYTQLRQELDLMVDNDIFQLDHWNADTVKHNPGVDRLHPAHPPTFPTPYFSYPEISKGLAGAGDILMLTPAGARRVLEWSSDEPYHLIEYLLWKKSFEVTDRCISTIVPAHWVWGPILLTPVTGQSESDRLLLDESEDLST